MKNFIPYFIQEKFNNGEQHGCFPAFSMFIDLSGFTILTETLMKKGTEGAEQLSFSLNNIFAPLVALVYQENAFIPYFAGDAFTAVFPKDSLTGGVDSFLKIACTLRDSFSRKNVISTSFGDFHIGVKIGLAYGDVEWGIVGDKYNAFYFRGESIEESAKSQLFAGEQDIILHESVFCLLNRNDFHIKTLSEKGQYQLMDYPLHEPGEKSQVASAELDKAVLSHFLPASILNFDHIGEFRNVISIFIAFAGVENHELMNRFATIVLNQINEFSGYFKEVDFGDKGGVLLGFFGAPVSYENNVERALEFILSVKEEILETLGDEIHFKAGITSGIAYTGIVGGEERCQYAAVGNSVNLAVRLMTKADWGEVLVDDEMSKDKRFRFTHKGDITYKGIEGDIPTYNLIGRSLQDDAEFEGQMVGREAELAELMGFAEMLGANQFAGIASIYGEAGIGKSRLTFEFRQGMQKKYKLKWLRCQADQILQKPFNPFTFLLRDFFHHSSESSVGQNEVHFSAHFDKFIAELELLENPESEIVVKELQRTKSVLAALIGLKLKDSIWEQLDGKGRYQNTLSAFESFFRACALLSPVVIELEDAHWYDNSSIEFLNDFARKMVNYPILILLSSRYLDNGSKPKIYKLDPSLQDKIPQLEIDLNTLSAKALNVFAETKLDGVLDGEFLQLLQRTTNGNPFYVEQILEYFRESKLLNNRDGVWYIKDKNVKLSTSINAILMARIDRLSALVKETVKAAAVIGREFEVPVLSEVMKSQDLFQRRNGNSNLVLKEQIQKAELGQIWRAVNELKYIFKHSLLRETVYSMQLRTRLRELHRLIGEAIEKLYIDNIEQRYVDLAYHFEQAAISDKTSFYLNKAASYSKRNYQNDRALFYLNKLLDIEIDLKERVRYSLDKGTVLELVGRWEEAKAVFAEALELSREQDNIILQGRACNQMGHSLMLKGAYEQATPFLTEAITIFEAEHDEVGHARALGNLGDLYFRQGKYEKAKSFFAHSIELSNGHAIRSYNAQIVANLGLTYMNQGNYEMGVKVQQKQLAIFETANDKQGMATLLINLGIVYNEKGDFDAAQAAFEKGLELSEALGNKLLISIGLGSLGLVHQGKGDYDRAMSLFKQDLKFCEELGDKQGISIASGLIGELLNIVGELEDAMVFLKKNLALSEELGYQKGIAKALNVLGDIHVNKQDFKLAAEYYEKAIVISRAINNKLVLGCSLVEKGIVLCWLNKLDEAGDALVKAAEIAQELAQPQLVFETRILKAILCRKNAQPKMALQLLEDMLKTKRGSDELADIYYEIYKTFPQDKFSKNKALELYEALFEDTPQYKFKTRIEELTQLENPAEY